MVDLVCCLTSLSFFDIPLLYYYVNLSIYIYIYIIYIYIYIIYIYIYIYIYICILFWYFSFTVCKVFWGDSFVILLAILLRMKSLVASGVFWIALFEAVLNASVADC